MEGFFCPRTLLTDHIVQSIEWQAGQILKNANDARFAAGYVPLNRGSGGRIKTPKPLDQGAFFRSILADHRNRLTDLDRQVDLIQRCGVRVTILKMKLIQPESYR